MSHLRLRWSLALLLIGMTCSAGQSQSKTPVTGPATESRFPKLITAQGYNATLFACDPLVEYPSVICLGPRPGTLFVAHDYVTGLGVKILRRDEIRLLADTDNDGYADRSQVFAKGFNSVQGLAYDGHYVYVMHAPLLTRLQDKDGDGKSDKRIDLVDGLGLPPEENSNRLHCANGVVVGHDDWLYLALGDRGCDVERREGDRLLFQGGGILRCRNDGSDLHVFCRGLRNIYDVALDDQLNVFVRDNENDGGDYMIRVCRCFFGSHHGYPYHYNVRPQEAMPPLADLGRGSSAGGTAYLETAFPKEMRESLFFCEWGRAVVTYRLQERGSSFSASKEADFARGADTDPYGFKPTDVIVDWDGSLVISDWGDGQRPKRGRGRIYRIRHKNAPATPAHPDAVEMSTIQLIKQLESPSHYTRLGSHRELRKRAQSKDSHAYDTICAELTNDRRGWRARSHLVWIVSLADRPKSLELLFRVANSNSDARLRVQAIRACADRLDPVLVNHQLAAKRASEKDGERFKRLRIDDPRVRLAVLVALQRLRVSSSPDWLRTRSQGLDATTSHAAKQLLTASGNWPAILAWLDHPSHKTHGDQTSHELAVMATLDQFNQSLVDELMRRLADRSTPSKTRRLIVDALALVQRKSKPWEYWGFRPQPRPANTVSWSRTEPITAALHACLTDPDNTVREVAARRMLRENIDFPLKPLAKWLVTERNDAHVATILAVLRNRPFASTERLLIGIVREPGHAEARRLDALELYLKGSKEQHAALLLKLIQDLEDGNVLATVIRKLPKETDSPLLLAKVASPSASVRAASIAALEQRGVAISAALIRQRLRDKDQSVQIAAVSYVGSLDIRELGNELLDLARSKNSTLRAAALVSLRQLKNGSAVPTAVASLSRAGSQEAALAYLQDFGDVRHADAVAKVAYASHDINIHRHAIRALTRWQEQSIASQQIHYRLGTLVARIQAIAGTPQRWRVRRADQETARVIFSSGLDGEVRWPKTLPKGSTCTATTQVSLDAPEEVEFLAGSSGTLLIDVNGQTLLKRDKPSGYRLDSDRKTTRLRKGMNVITVKSRDGGNSSRFHLRFRRKSARAEQDQLIRDLLTSRGNVQRGREVFENIDKSQCMKCHRLAEKGPKIGPDLSGLGSRFSKIYIVESILQPSRTVSPSYTSFAIRMTDGKVLAGVKIAESAQHITFGDQTGKQHTVAKADIEQLAAQTTSIMPEGLEKRLSRRELADLIAYLMAQKR